MILAGILALYYKGAYKNKAIALLNSLCCYTELEVAALRFYTSVSLASKEEKLLLFRGLMDKYFCSTLPLLDLCGKKDKDIGKRLEMLNLMVFLIVDAMSMSETTVIEFLQWLENRQAQKSDGLNCNGCIYNNFSALLVKYCDDFGLPTPSAEHHEINNINRILGWNEWKDDKKNGINFTDFIKDLEKLFYGSGPTKAWFAMFNIKMKQQFLAMPEKYVIAFLILFDLFQKSERISCCHGHGLMAFLKSRLKAAKGEVLPLRHDYAKLKSEALHDSEKRLWCYKKLYEIYHLYCPSEKCRIFYDEYFGII